jgi:hypothetical protein
MQSSGSAECTRPPIALVRSPSGLSRHQPNSQEVFREPPTWNEIQNTTTANLDALESQDHERSDISRSRQARQSPQFLMGLLNRRREGGSGLASMPNQEVRPVSDTRCPTDSGVAATILHEEIVKTRSTGDYCFLCFTSGTPGRDCAMKVSVDCPKLRLSYQCEKPSRCHEFGTDGCTLRSKTLEGGEDVPFAQLRKATFRAHGRWKMWIPYYDVKEVQEIRVRHMSFFGIVAS